MSGLKYPTAIPNLSGNESIYLQKCIDSGFVSTGGEFIPKFESQIESVSGSKNAVALNSGTSALHMSLIASDVQADDLVICPSLTFIASANAIKYCHADPLFIDIETETFCISPSAIQKYISESCKYENDVLIDCGTNRTIKAILAVSFLGNSGLFEDLYKLAKEYNLKLIIDAAASIGLKPKGRPIVDFADFVTYSFNGNKTITSGGGGAIVSKDDEALAHIRHISSTARPGSEYIHDFVGYNYRITNIEAAVGLAQIEQLDKFLKKKKDFYDFYSKNLKKVRMIPYSEEFGSVHWFSGFIWEKDFPSTDQIISFMNSIGCDTRPFWCPVNLSAPFKECPSSSLTNTMNNYNKLVILPSSTTLELSELNEVCQQLNNYLESHES